MPTRYKPELDHEPLGWGSEEGGDADAEVERLVAGLRANTNRIVGAFRQCGVELEYDDVGPLLTRLQVLMVKFVAECRAHPMRTARRLRRTVTEIQRNPEAFLRDVGRYSPEASALVYEMFLRLFPGTCDLAAFEAGIGPAPGIANLVRAADAAISVLEHEAERQGKGRPKMALLDQLAMELARQFQGSGGHLRRTVHIEETGPFFSFVEAVVSPARQLVGVSGYSLTTRVIVQRARDS